MMGILAFSCDHQGKEDRFRREESPSTILFRIEPGLLYRISGAFFLEVSRQFFLLALAIFPSLFQYLPPPQGPPREKSHPERTRDLIFPGFFR
jgi:hypothetical protein